jgi:hypothetical protein
MQTDLILPGSLNLSEQERAFCAWRAYAEPSAVTAHRLGQQLAAVICARFPSLDRVLLEKQIESDYLDWALQRGVFVGSLRRSL